MYEHTLSLSRRCWDGPHYYQPVIQCFCFQSIVREQIFGPVFCFIWILITEQLCVEGRSTPGRGTSFPTVLVIFSHPKAQSRTNSKKEKIWRKLVFPLMLSRVFGIKL